MQISIFSLSVLFQMKTEKERGGVELFEKQCTPCRRTEMMGADIDLYCWEINGGPFPAFDCPFCSRGMRIPKQVIDETEEAEEKEKHLGREKSKR